MSLLVYFIDAFCYFWYVSRVVLSQKNKKCKLDVNKHDNFSNGILVSYLFLCIILFDGSSIR